MRTKAAVAVAAGKPLGIMEVNVEGPRAEEVLVEISSTAIVFFFGGIGLNVIQGLRLAGADLIVGIDLLQCSFVAINSNCPPPSVMS